ALADGFHQHGVGRGALAGQAVHLQPDHFAGPHHFLPGSDRGIAAVERLHGAIQHLQNAAGIGGSSGSTESRVARDDDFGLLGGSAGYEGARQGGSEETPASDAVLWADAHGSCSGSFSNSDSFIALAADRGQGVADFCERRLRERSGSDAAIPPDSASIAQPKRASPDVNNWMAWTPLRIASLPRFFGPKICF